MRRVIATTVGLASAIALTVGTLYMIDVGSCGSSGPACPPGSGPYLAAFTVGLLGLIFSGFFGGALSWPVIPVLFTVGFVLKAQVDRAPDERLALHIAAGVSAVVSVLVIRGIGGAIRKQRKLAHVLAHGSKGRGHITAIRDTGTRINDQPRVELSVRIEPLDGTAPFEGSKTVTVSDVSPPRRGDVYPVWFDPTDHATWALGIPDAGQPLDPAVIEEFRLRFDGVGGASEGGVDDLSRIAALERLARLRDDGVLSASEFEREKDRLLD